MLSNRSEAIGNSRWIKVCSKDSAVLQIGFLKIRQRIVVFATILLVQTNSAMVGKLSDVRQALGLSQYKIFIWINTIQISQLYTIN